MTYFSFYLKKKSCEIVRIGYVTTSVVSLKVLNSYFSP